MTCSERAYDSRPSRESAFLCMAICGAVMLVRGVIAAVIP